MVRAPAARGVSRDDIRTRLLAVQEKSDFVPNVFLALAWRPDEFRVPTHFQSKPASVRTNPGAENAMRMMRERTQSEDGVRVEHGPADVTNKNEITNSSNTTESPVDISFREARSHSSVDGCAASV
jgi:hypothetical protein